MISNEIELCIDDIKDRLKHRMSIVYLESIWIKKKSINSSHRNKTFSLSMNSQFSVRRHFYVNVIKTGLGLNWRPRRHNNTQELSKIVSFLDELHIARNLTRDVPFVDNTLYRRSMLGVD